MREMPAVKRMDTAVFLFLSILIGGSVLFGYRTFAIPPSHYVYLSCGGSCEKIVSESLWQTRHLWKFGKRKRDGDESHREMVASYLTQSTLSTFLKNHAGQPTRPSDVNILLYETIHLVRAGLYRPLYLLSVLFGLSFHFLFSIVLAILMMTTAILAEKITINVRQTWGRGLYLAAQMIPFFFTHGRLVVLAFSVVLLLYLHLAPPPPARTHEKYASIGPWVRMPSLRHSFYRDILCGLCRVCCLNDPAVEDHRHSRESHLAPTACAGFLSLRSLRGFEKSLLL